MKIICITGKAGSGKDTVAQYMKDELEYTYGKHVLIIHFADYLKYICTAIFGWDGKKDEKGRALLQRVGTDIIRNKSPNFWARAVTDILFCFKNKYDIAIIPDCRFPNEIEYLKCGFDVSLLRIERPNYDNGLSEEAKLHESENAMNDYHADATIINDGDKFTLCYNALSYLSYCDENKLI